MKYHREGVPPYIEIRSADSTELVPDGLCLVSVVD